MAARHSTCRGGVVGELRGSSPALSLTAGSLQKGKEPEAKAQTLSQVSLKVAQTPSAHVPWPPQAAREAEMPSPALGPRRRGNQLWWAASYCQRRTRAKTRHLWASVHSPVRWRGHIQGSSCNSNIFHFQLGGMSDSAVPFTVPS